MMSSSGTFGLRCLAVWNAVRAVWVGYFAVVDLLTLAAVRGPKGPYFGIGVTARLLIIIAAMPLKLIGVLAGLRVELTGDTTVQILATTGYACVAIGIWRHRDGMRRFAIALGILEFVLLALYLSDIACYNLFSELRPIALVSSSAFMAVYGLIAIWLSVPDTRRLFGSESAVGN